MSYARAYELIWDPDRHPLADVAEAAEVVLSSRYARPLDVQQAVYLITTFRPR